MTYDGITANLADFTNIMYWITKKDPFHLKTQDSVKVR